LNERTNHDAEAIEGANGQYDVLLDGELIFSKEREGRFPEEDEIFAAVG
jgi:selT/selW/selH-like putative selenoprotein